MIAISMAGKFPRLPLLRKPQNWTEWVWDTVCLIPVLYVLIYVLEFSAGLMITVSVAAQLGTAWRISKIDKVQNAETDLDG
jgi:hypothetical protein